MRASSQLSRHSVQVPAKVEAARSFPGPRLSGMMGCGSPQSPGQTPLQRAWEANARKTRHGFLSNILKYNYIVSYFHHILSTAANMAGRNCRYGAPSNKRGCNTLPAMQTAPSSPANPRVFPFWHTRSRRAMGMADGGDEQLVMTTKSRSEKFHSAATLSTFVRFPEEAASENAGGCQSLVETTSELNLHASRCLACFPVSEILLGVNVVTGEG